MPYHYGFCGVWRNDDRPKVGRPKRDRAKVKAGRRAARKGR